MTLSHTDLLFLGTILLLTHFTGCTAAPALTSTNLTNVNIPASVDEKVWELLALEETGLQSIVITYTRQMRGGDSVCYVVEVTLEREERAITLFGLTSLVGGTWYTELPHGWRHEGCYEGLGVAI